MDPNLVPAIIFLAIIIFSPPSKEPREDGYSPENSKTALSQSKGPRIDPKIAKDKMEQECTRIQNPEEICKEQETLYQYIKSHHKQVSDDDAKTIAQYIVELSKEEKIDPKFVAAVMARESSFNKTAVSSTGAKGLGQIKDFNFKSLDIEDPYDIKQNSGGTVKYLKQMLNSWKGKSNQLALALASYYKGVNNIKRNAEQYDQETDNYVNDILKNYDKITDFKYNTKPTEKPKNTLPD